MPRPRHAERHAITRIGWLRAAVLGANDGLLSTASLILGVAAASADHQAILVAGVASLVAGSMSMAAGEYVSVSSQRDAEHADLAVEKRELKDDPEAELNELTGIYVKRGVAPDLAREVARQLTARDALAAHARDELGVTDAAAARPVQAALASAASFSVGAVLPLAVALLSPSNMLIWTVSAASLAFLAVLGALGAWTGGARMGRATLRVVFWGVLALAVTAGVGKLFGVSVG